MWFPDLRGCFAAGDTLDEALQNAPEALALWIETMRADGQDIPHARTPSELKNDPSVAAEMERFAIALIPAPDIALQPAAE
ncbi:hypothetical protein D3C87_2048620 [compost metagenome]